MDTHWSLGVLIGLPVAGLLILVGLAAIGLGVLMLRDGDGPALIIGGVAWTVFVTAWIAMPVVGFYPYSSEYHQWRHHGGTVATVNSRMIGVDGGSEQKFVVTFEGSPQQFGCNDTRCADVKVGDQLDLSCKRAWQYAGTDGYDCNFVNLQAGKASGMSKHGNDWE